MKDLCIRSCRDHTTRMQGTRTHGFQLVARLLPAHQPRDPMSAGSSAAGKRGARQAAPHARRGRQGGRSQQVQLVRVGRVDSFVQDLDGLPSRSRSRSGHRSQHTLELHYQVRLWCYQGRAPRRGRSMSLRPHAAPVAPRGVQTPLAPPSSPPSLPAQALGAASVQRAQRRKE